MALAARTQEHDFTRPARMLGSIELINSGRDLCVPFRLFLYRDGNPLELEVTRLLRVLPGKRFVAVALVDGEECLIKVYLGRSASRYARREMNGVGLIKEACVRTPELRWHGRLADDGGEVLAFEYLPSAISLFHRWREARHEEEKVDVLTRAMVIIGKLHNHGVVQNDIHLANFLLSSGRLYTIDGGDIVRKSQPPLPEPRSLQNLGMFFAQFFPRYDDLMQVVLPAYEAVRGWDVDPQRADRIGREIARNRRRRKRTYIRKAFRECTRFVCRSSFRRFLVCERASWSPSMEALMADIDAAMAAGVTIKNGNTSTVSLVQVDGRPLVIKRYNLKGRWHRIRRSVRHSRAWTSWANACRMEFLGIPSVKPVALVENRFGPLRGKAYFITEYVEGEDALKCLRALKRPAGELEAVSSILFELSDCRVSHGDMKATNIMMSPSGPIILDLDAMREHRTLLGFRRAFRRDLKRFMQNWQDRPELASRFAGLLGNLSS